MSNQVILYHIKQMDLRDGDMLVLKTDEELTSTQMSQLKDQITRQTGVNVRDNENELK